jgi:hypothetical protein
MASGSNIGANVRALSVYWHGLNAGATPARAQFDPMAIPALLPHVYLVELEADPFRVRYRLTGTKSDEWNGFNLTGRYIDEFLVPDLNGANRVLIAAYRASWLSGQPTYSKYYWPTRSGLQMVVGFGVFPLTVDDKIAQALAIEDIEAAPIADEWVPFEDTTKPAKKT